MDLFRLTYFVGGRGETDKWKCSHRFEVWGSREAIGDLYFHLKQLEGLSDKGVHPSACPRFINILNKDGVSQLKELNNFGLVGFSSDNTFE